MTTRPQRPTPATAGVLLWTAAIAGTAVVLGGCGPSEPPDAAALFAANCAVCHGPAAQGVEDQGPSLLEDRYLADAYPDEAMAAAIRQGVASSEERWAPMPSFPRFDDAQLDAVVGYVRELQRRAALSDG
jgi:mono/diheme cytochrome c family protein